MLQRRRPRRHPRAHARARHRDAARRPRSRETAPRRARSSSWHSTAAPGSSDWSAWSGHMAETLARCASPTRLPRAPERLLVAAPRAGVVRACDPLELGRVALALGAGRSRADQRIDPAVGIELVAKRGDRVVKGAPLAFLHARSRRGNEPLVARAAGAFTIGRSSPTPRSCWSAWDECRSRLGSLETVFFANRYSWMALAVPAKVCRSVHALTRLWRPGRGRAGTLRRRPGRRRPPCPRWSRTSSSAARGSRPNHQPTDQRRGS